MTELRFLGRAAAPALLLLLAAAAAAAAEPPHQAPTTITTNDDGNVVIVSDQDRGRRERRVLTIRTDGPGPHKLRGESGATYVVEGDMVKIYATGRPDTAIARGDRDPLVIADRAERPDCTRDVVENKGAGTRGRTVTILCARRASAPATIPPAERIERLEHALARIEREDRLSPEAREQVEKALREAIGQMRGNQ